MKSVIQYIFILLLIICGLPASAQYARTWATYCGGTGMDVGRMLATDALGNVYFAGETDSNAGIASSGFQNSYGGGGNDAFLVKFDSIGNFLWATYYGGTGYDLGLNVATDDSGNVYLAGETNSTDDIASGGFQNSFGGGSFDAFLVKFDSSGNRLWASYYGGTGTDYSSGLATDDSGNVYLAGTTNSTAAISFGGFQNNYGGGLDDAFLVKFDPAGNRIWATYYGGMAFDEGLSTATDASGNVYFAVHTTSNTGMALGGFQNTYGGGGDAVLVKFDTIGNRLWATYYGGTGNEVGRGIATDASGNVYFGGWTASSNNISSGGFQNIYGGNVDAFLVKFDAVGNRMWATYYGDISDDRGWSIATDASGNVFLVGWTTSTSSIATGGFQNVLGGAWDAYLVKFDASGNRFCATYYGGVGDDFAEYVAADISGNVYLAGYTTNNADIASGGFQNIYGGGPYDAFLVKFTSEASPLSVPVYVDIACGEIFIPNAFSPNGDTQNDILYVRGNYIESMDLQVYDRWGKKVFTSKDPAHGWDGTYEGQVCEAAVFTYNLRAKLLDGTFKATEGTITLVK